jgi:hypothetical protein
MLNFCSALARRAPRALDRVSFLGYASHGTCALLRWRKNGGCDQHAWDCIPPPSRGHIGVAIGPLSRWFLARTSEVEIRPPAYAGPKNRVPGTRGRVHSANPLGCQNDARPAGVRCECASLYLGHSFCTAHPLPLPFVVFVVSLLPLYPKFI